MNELAASPSSGNVSAPNQQKPIPCLTDVDWSVSYQAVHCQLEPFQC